MSGERLRVAVVYGGRNGEHDVSRHSAQSVVANLDRSRYAVVPVRIDREGNWSVGCELPADVTVPDLDRFVPDPDPAVSLAAGVLAGIERLRACDVVFPALHGPYGEDGTAQSCFAAAGVAVVGCGVLAGALAMDKIRTKKLVAAAGLAVADSIALPAGADDLDPAARARLGLPVFVKPVRAGSSLGVSRVRDWADLPAAVRLARRSDRRVMVERAVPGREIDIGVLQLPSGGTVVSPPLEIGVPDGAVFDYHAKYADPDTVFTVPAALDEATTRRMAEQARLAFDTLGCAGLARVDFFLRADGELVLNEINTFPGFTAASQYPRMWQAAGLDFPALLDILLATALASAPAAERSR